MSNTKREDLFSPENVLELIERWQVARAGLIEMFPYKKDEANRERPEVFAGLIHDGNRAENMSKISTGEDQSRSLRVRWGHELKWFIKIAEYVLEKENEVMTLEISKQVMFDMLVDVYVDELSVDRGQAHAMIAFDFENNLEAQDLP